MGESVEVTRPARGWSEWTPVAGLPALSPAVLGEILDGGQAFRWHALSETTWIGAWGNAVVQLRLSPRGTPEWSAPEAIAPRTGDSLRAYLGATTDFETLTSQLPWRSDAHLAQCVASFPGLRLLRQPFGETLLGFLCSATKQIVQIKQMVQLLAERHGEVIARVPTWPASTAPETASRRADGGIIVHALPGWDALAEVPEAELRRCLLGFRARYIADVARFLHAHPGWLDETESLPYVEAKERLCALPGVGEKVADCVLLFGAGRLEAFPVDVWILKTLERRYGLDGWKPTQLAQFGRAHFGPLAGLAQQYLFAWERRFAPRTRRAALD